MKDKLGITLTGTECILKLCRKLRSSVRDNANRKSMEQTDFAKGSSIKVMKWKKKRSTTVDTTGITL